MEKRLRRKRTGTYTVAEVTEDLIIAVSFIEKNVLQSQKVYRPTVKNGTFTEMTMPIIMEPGPARSEPRIKIMVSIAPLVNGVHVNIPANNNTANTEIVGMEIAVSRSIAGYAYQYKISISNIKQDLDVEGHLRKKQRIRNCNWFRLKVLMFIIEWKRVGKNISRLRGKIQL